MYHGGEYWKLEDTSYYCEMTQVETFKPNVAWGKRFKHFSKK